MNCANNTCILNTFCLQTNKKNVEIATYRCRVKLGQLSVQFTRTILIGCRYADKRCSTGKYK